MPGASQKTVVSVSLITPAYLVVEPSPIYRFKLKIELYKVDFPTDVGPIKQMCFFFFLILEGDI